MALSPPPPGGLGTATFDQEIPSQCRTRGLVPPVARGLAPATHTLVGDRATTALTGSFVESGGTLTLSHVEPSQWRTNASGWAGLGLPPTAHASFGPSAETPTSSQSVALV